MPNSAEFTAAAKKPETFTKRPTDEELLELYGLYKQATVGDINISKPWFTDPKGQYKWEAWNKRKGMSKQEAEEKYIALVATLSERYI